MEVLEPVKQLKTALRMSFAVNWTDFSPVSKAFYGYTAYNRGDSGTGGKEVV